MVIVYRVIGDPFANGWVQSIMMLLPEIAVVGTPG